MVTLTWFNLVAISIAIIAIASLLGLNYIVSRRNDLQGTLTLAFGFILWVLFFGLFFSIWGGIFWW